MNKMNQLMLSIAFLLLGQICFSNSSGQLFNVSISGTTLTFTPKANHSYPDLGLLITSSGYSFSKPNTQCSGWPNTKGYCKFAASHTSPASVSLHGPTGVLNFKICLNFWGKLSCQKYTINISPQDQCAAAGGKIVLGSNNCWVKQTISVSPIVLRCSDVCANVGLVLQQPGPTSNELLAGNVCAAYGYTDTPIRIAPGTITFIGEADISGQTLCVWENLTGTNWDNPSNTDNAGVAGNYFCPCI